MNEKTVWASSDIGAIYAKRLLEMILSRGNTMPRSYGFEYEFLPHRRLDMDDMLKLGTFLKGKGYSHDDGTYTRGTRQVVFEPGGQIEYLSPPMIAGDTRKLREILDWIAGTNADIEMHLGIRYVGTGFMPGRYDAPLLLTSPRYSLMHDRFIAVDLRGPEMMKGTAAIHMHAAIICARDIETLFEAFCRMSRSDTLGMSPGRREIWYRTDSCRCGLPQVKGGQGASSILECIVDQAMEAVELRSGKVFRNLEGRDFSDFLDHLTTMFTDVRVNVKGGTMELRTPDSRPINEFPSVWQEFVQECEKVT
jgi:gamma-glutamylcysteine synthetase